MEQYQEEYIANLRQFAALAQRKRPGALTCEEYTAQMEENRAQIARLNKRNMELLRSGLFPILDNLFDASQEQVTELEEFSFQLFNGQKELDVGLFCQIHQALLTLARQKQDLNMMIRELYWLGLSRNSLVSKLVGLEMSDTREYSDRMRLCFTEAAAYLKYFDLINDTDTRGYILRSRANIALGQFSTPREKIALLKDSLAIYQSKQYQEKAPSLPWDRFIYLTHQNITSSISHSREMVMTPEDMADIMESAYIVYQRRFDEAEIQGKQPPAKSAFAYYAIEYYCGFNSLDTLLSKIEELLDAADPTNYTLDGMYSMISLPAFYSQYLSQYPDHIPPRKEYLENLYRRVLRYVDAYPGELGNGSLFLYLRQLSFTFVETGGVSYGDFLQKLLLRFATEIFLHTQSVAAAARTFSDIILKDDPGFFDDIDFIRRIPDPDQKRRAVMDYAMGCGMFHDIGKISVIELYSRTPRQWFEEEYDMARLHTTAGAAYLSLCPSTIRYADAALGHHTWYDGSRGYPASYKRLECPARQMVDLIGLIDWLENKTNFAPIYGDGGKPLNQAVQEAVKLEGRRFSPLLTAFLRDPGVVEQLKQAYAQGRQDACRRMYDDALSAAPQQET